MQANVLKSLNDHAQNSALMSFSCIMCRICVFYTVRLMYLIRFYSDVALLYDAYSVKCFQVFVKAQIKFVIITVLKLLLLLQHCVHLLSDRKH